MVSNVAIVLMSVFATALGFSQGSVLPRYAMRQIAKMEAEAPAVVPPDDTALDDALPAPSMAPAIEYSESLPFLVKRKNLAGYVGDVGFDPLGFSDILPMDWLREAELKHARVCMLATVGFAFTDFYTLPGFEYTTLEAHDACVASGAMSQLLLWIGLLEVFSFVAIDQMLRGSGRVAGDYGFDPLGFASDPAKLQSLQMKELANGRLAMFAFSGFVTQAVLTGNTFPYLFN
eukprot:CAMPEP_0119309782 /NCGR_PEP_ID=MMETSP1333-20130426/16707_1 /TAXON_ID=418940 /ORGANISM="Scyphosphaera apsteinii, Strain RCC1455" /LENGTH=231 /DNA_ID=CAMNT_0007313811 /DNA_START=14 /DNA_END=709 /DNA_ORIENTATION=+